MQQPDKQPDPQPDPQSDAGNKRSTEPTKPGDRSPSNRDKISSSNGYRVKQRRLSHQSAKDEAFTPPTIPDHPLVPAEEPVLIETAEALDAFVGHIQDTGSFAYDTEFIGELSYYPLLCVIQLATSERIALIDPFAEIDLTGVWELIADPDIVTLLHAGMQDLEPVVRHIGKAPANIFDTQIAAGFAELRYPIGLRDLVASTVGVELGKALTFTSWDHRPLSKRHRHYAADDVRYLPAVHADLTERLQKLGRESWARSECDLLSDVSLYQFDPDVQSARVKAGGLAKPRDQVVLRELVVMRDKLARQRDSPPRSLMKDAVLIDLARHPVTTAAELRDVKGLPRWIKEHHAKTVLDAIERGRIIPKGELPKRTVIRNMPVERERIDTLWKQINAACEQARIHTQLVASRREIANFHLAAIRRRRAGDDSNGDSRLLTGWRKTIVGDVLRQHLEDVVFKHHKKPTPK